MAIPAGRPFVINPAFVTKARVRPVITRTPITCVMAFGAIIAEHSPVKTGISMTAGTERRSIAESLAVAAFTGQFGMSAGQPERGQVVVECGWFPGSCGVAGVATCSKTTFVLVVCSMAGIASGRRPFKGAVLVALGTFNSEVSSGQFENGSLVVKGRRFPRLRGMA